MRTIKNPKFAHLTTAALAAQRQKLEEVGGPYAAGLEELDAELGNRAILDAFQVAVDAVSRANAKYYRA